MPEKLHRKSLDEFDEIELNGTIDTEKNFEWESFVFNNRKHLTLLIVGVILLGFGVIYIKVGETDSTKLEIIEKVGQTNGGDKLVVEIAGAVEKPGVYEMDNGKRINDLLIAAGGISANADRVWIDKYLNKAGILTDAQKIYIPSVNEQLNIESANILGTSSEGDIDIGTASERLVNINTATLNELDKLPGIGPVYGQSIIDHRPYSIIEDLMTKDALRENVYEKIKDKVTVY